MACLTFQNGRQFASLPSLISHKLEVGPQIQLGGLGSDVSSPSGMWGGASAEIEFGAFLP